MKKYIALLLAALLLLSLAACGSSSGSSSGSNSSGSSSTSSGSSIAGEYDITVWVADAIVDLTKQQIEDYNSSNTDGIKFNATVEPVGEGNAATQMITDVEAGADIFCFAQDQFARLIQAGALSQLGEGAAATVQAANDPSVVSAGMTGDKLYAYPLTSDNGYFMYYDKSVIPEEDVDSLEKLIADCEAAGRMFSFQIEKDGGWYTASFFFGAGCVSEWETDSDGAFISVNDNFNSDKGLIAVKGMKKLVDSASWSNTSAGEDFGAATPSAVVVSGTWAYETVKGILGDNLGATDLPSFTVDGQEYHLGSFSGCKLMGVKPQTNAAKSAALHKLAQYLTGYDCQMERFDAVSWGPANTEAQKSEAVQANPGLAALLAQSPYAVPQGQVHGSWWSIVTVITTEVQEATDEAGLKAALQNYEDTISGLFNLSGYIFVGAWNGWSNSDGNYKMQDQGDGTMAITVTVEQSDYMGGRIVTAGDWDTDKGLAQVTTGAELISDDGGSDNNIVFLAPGTYTVVWNTSTNEITITAD